MIAPHVQKISPIAIDVYEGLGATPKRLPAKLFYDARGSALFEEITRLPEYYVTRTEAAILEAYAPEICKLAGTNLSVIELAAGSAKKTRILLEELLRKQFGVVYAPVDVSPAALATARKTIAGSLSQVRVQPVLSEMEDLTFLRNYRAPRLILFIGSTIGNMEDCDAVALLRRIAAEMGADDHLLLGTDRVKAASVLVPAYDDAQGVTSQFNLNVLARINRELGGSFDLDSFAHVALWDRERSRIEMHLESRREQTVFVRDLGLTVEFKAGERIHTENSNKYTLSRVRTILKSAGLNLKRTWTDDQRWYGVHLANLQ